MRELTQHLSALIIVGLCVAALFAAGAGVSGFAARAYATLGGGSAADSPLSLAAGAAAQLEALRSAFPLDRARLRWVGAASR